MYPRQPPLVTFSTDIFHPLVSPLSNYTYSTDVQDNGTVSASDDERLPPGGFSLRHGFPGWFGRARGGSGPPQTPPRGGISAPETPESRPTPKGATPGYMRGDEAVSTFDVLTYMRSVFDDDDVLDGVGLEAAGNANAWHAWRTHRKAAGKEFGGEEAGQPGGEGPRHPGSWDWDGVWEDRVKGCIAGSLSEAVLYGGAGGVDDVVGAPFPRHKTLGFDQY